jgi:hypothetical protein
VCACGCGDLRGVRSLMMEDDGYTAGVGGEEDRAELGEVRLWGEAVLPQEGRVDAVKGQRVGRDLGGGGGGRGRLACWRV